MCEPSIVYKCHLKSRWVIYCAAVIMDAVVKWTAVLVLCIACAHAEDNSFEGCLRRDSISCVQQHVYRKLRAVFGQDNINLLGGFQLIKTDAGRSLEDNMIDDEIMGDASVPERQEALESYALQRISNFFNERTWTWAITPAVEQLVSTARMAASNVPEEIREKVSAYVFEGRGRRKTMKTLVPLLLFAKLKLASIWGLSYAVVALIAKKALVASVLALVITLFISIKKLLIKHHHPVVHDYHALDHHKSSHVSLADRSSWAPWSGWDTYDNRGAHSASSHHLAYTPQKPTLR